MPQLILPLFPEGSTHITPELVVTVENGQVTYFHGCLPVFTHDQKDTRTFFMINSQFCCNGVAKQSDIVRIFGVTARVIKRGVKRYRELGPAGFYAQRKSRGPAVLTASVLEEAQSLLDGGSGVPEVAEALRIKRNTLAKAVRAGRLHANKNERPCSEGDDTSLACKSGRSVQDAAAPMGMGATNTLARVAASVGLANAAEIEFRLSIDVPNAGVLLALPALLAVGLLRYTAKHFTLPKGYYGLESIFLLLALMALARFKTIESLRYYAPGEWGKLLGLDRIPEVRTLREKIHLLTESGSPTKWSAELCSYWMEAAPENAAAFYVDGHVRVYHGDTANLPRHYVARQKLCLRASADYWVNAMGGQPFFVVPQDVDPGLVSVLQNQIVPRLLEDAPNQPTPEQLKENKLLHRFVVVFDREGYSPKLLSDLKEDRIACLTYHKYPGEDWALSEFLPCLVPLVSGHQEEMMLAERGVPLGDGLVWVREIRKLTSSGHQTSVLSTDYLTDQVLLAAAMFARWCQENYFRYMRKEYNLDRILTYGVEDIPGDTRVVNPEHRRLDGDVRKVTAQLVRKRAQLQAMDLSQVTDHEKLEKFQQVQGELLEDVTRLAEDQTKLKQKRKEVAKHIEARELPPEERIDRLATQSKHFIDTIKMVAYRAETAMANVLREMMSRPDDARELLRAIYSSEADLIPNENDKTLTIRLHHLANRSSDEAIRHLCNELNATETVFPGTDLRMVYELVSAQNPRDQEV